MRSGGVTACACALLSAAVLLAVGAAPAAAQRGLAQGAVFQPLILPRAEVLAHRNAAKAANGANAQAHATWDELQALSWTPAAVKAASASAPAAAAAAGDAAPLIPPKATAEDLRAAMHAAAAARRAAAAAAAAPAAATAVPATVVAADTTPAPVPADVFRARTAWERDAEQGIRTLAAAVARHAKVISRNRERAVSLRALSARLQAQLARDEAAVQKLQQNQSQRLANKLVIKTLVRRADEAAKAIKQIAALVGENRRHVITDASAAGQQAQRVDDGVLTLAKAAKAHGARLDAIERALSAMDGTKLSRRLAKVVVAMGLEAKAIKRDESRIANNKHDIAAAATARQTLRDTVTELATRLGAVGAAAQEHKQLLDALRTEVEAVKAGDASRDSAIHTLAAKLQALEKKAEAAELDANDAHHKADAATDLVAALQRSHKQTEAALTANVAAVAAASDRLAGANTVAADHSKRLTEVVSELHALSSRLDLMEAAEQRARAHTTAQIAHNTAVGTANTARTTEVAANTVTAEKALAGLSALGQKLAVLQNTVKQQAAAAEARGKAAAQQRQQLTAVVGALQQRAAAQEAQAQARAKAVAQAQAQAQAKARAAQIAAQQQAQAQAIARARAAQHQQQLQAQQARAATAAKAKGKGKF